MILIRKHIATLTSSTLLVAALASVTLTSAGCERKKSPADKVEDAVDDVGDEIEEAADD